MKISIVIPTYNVEKYIRECLESVAYQTYTGDMECIIVDDCGTDKSIAIAEDFILHFQGKVDFKIIHREQNGGLSAARNSGTRVASGDYIYYLDSDDYIKPDCIDSLVKVAMRFPQAEVIQAGNMRSDSRISFNAETAAYPDVITDYQTIIRNILYQERLPVTAWNKLIRRDFLVKNNINFIEGIIYEDVDFEFRLAKYISCWALSRSNSYIYRINREGSITNVDNSANGRTHDSRMKTFHRCLDDIDERNVNVFTRAIFLYLQLFLIDTPRKTDKYRDVRKLYCALQKKSRFDMRFLMRLYDCFPDKVKSKTQFKNLFNKFLLNI